MGLLNDFVRCGLLSERVVENPVDKEVLPKVNDEAGQVTHSASDKGKKPEAMSKKADDKSVIEALKVVHMGMCAARDQMNSVMDLVKGEELKSGLAEKAQALSDICDAVGELVGGDSGDGEKSDADVSDATAKVPEKQSSGGGSSGWKSLGGGKPSATPSATPAQKAAPAGGEAPPKGGEG